MLGNLLSRLLGLGREAVVVGLFGLTASTSAFLTAATVPTMVYDLLVGGAISAALIPVLADHVRPDGELTEYGRLAGALLTMFAIVTASVALILELAAPLVVTALGASADPTVFAETTAMVRLILPSVIFLGEAGVLQAVLQARGIFRYTAVSTACFNGGIIVGGLGLAWVLGPRALVVGLLLGAALQAGVQFVGLRGVPLRLVPDLRNPSLRRAARLYMPVAAGLLVSQVGILIDRNLAWRTGESSIALMRTATTLVQLPIGLVATATSFAVLPTLARAADRDESAFVRTLAFGVRLTILAMVPSTAALVLLREPVVHLLFQRGQFTAADTALTGAAFLWYAPQMPFWAVDQLLIIAFYARKDTVTPVVVGVLGVLLYLAVALTTVGALGVFGLILANTAQNSAHCVVMYGLLLRSGRGLAGHGIGLLLVRCLVASLVAAVVFLVGERALGAPPEGAHANVLWLAVVGGAMAVAIVSALALMRTRELLDFADAARRRFRASTAAA
jgi:putative peptidoglycan lipid II flippase